MLLYSNAARLLFSTAVILAVAILLTSNAAAQNSGASDETAVQDAGQADKAVDESTGSGDADDSKVEESKADDSTDGSGEPESDDSDTEDDSAAKPKVEFQVDKLNSGDTAWILTATALVLFMTIPGLALFYGGLVRSKNILSVLMHCLIITAVVSIIWVLFGFTLAFDGSNAEGKIGIGLHTFLGGYHHVGLANLQGSIWSGTGLPSLLIAAFQMTFAIITPALIIGAFAERMKFVSVVLFSGLWLIVVYLPICHMTWGGGLFAMWHVKDLAGGIVVHVTAGFAALIACIMIGPRRGYPDHREPPHSTVLTLVGTGMLWVGWFGFNAGSQLAANEDAAMTLIVTHVSACMATLVWMTIEWVKFGKPSVLGAATGSIAGLAAITPASGDVGPLGALAIGAASGALCFFFATWVKRTFRYDDSLDVFGVHGVGGFLGTVLCGVFAHTMFGGGGYLDADGNDIGMNMANQTGVQLGAACITAVYAIIATFVILTFVKMLVGLRVSEEVEIRGLDLGEHEERGYINN